MCLPQQPIDKILRERLADVLAHLADDELEPAAQAALELEARKLRRLLTTCFQSPMAPTAPDCVQT